MLLLAFETSAKAASVALFQEEKLVGEAYQNTGMTHSQTLMVMAEATLQNSGFTAKDLTHVAVAAGPGSFTGVRIGVAAAKGLAWGNQIPCYGVSTLEAMALGFPGVNGIVCCVMDARRAEVYNALFAAENGALERLTPDRAISLKELSKELKKFEKPIFLVGDGSVLTYKTLQEEVPALVLPPESRMHQRAVGVGLCAIAQLRAGAPGNGADLAPNYLRLSQAERERKAREAQAR